MITFLYSLLILGFIGLILSISIDFAKAVEVGKQQLGITDFTERYEVEQSKTIDFLAQFNKEAMSSAKVKLGWVGWYFVFVTVIVPIFTIGSLIEIF